MDIMPIPVVIFGSIPEAILMLWAGLLLLGIKPPFRKILLVGILQGISAYFIRRFSPFGMHSVLQLITVIVYASLIIRVKVRTATIGALISFAVIILIEGTTLIFLKDQISYFFSNDWLRILLFLPHNILLGVMVYICDKKNISLLQESSVLQKIIG